MIVWSCRVCVWSLDWVTNMAAGHCRSACAASAAKSAAARMTAQTFSVAFHSAWFRHAFKHRLCFYLDKKKPPKRHYSNWKCKHLECCSGLYVWIVYMCVCVCVLQRCIGQATVRNTLCFKNVSFMCASALASSQSGGGEYSPGPDILHAGLHLTLCPCIALNRFLFVL